MTDTMLDSPLDKLDIDKAVAATSLKANGRRGASLNGSLDVEFNGGQADGLVLGRGVLDTRRLTTNTWQELGLASISQLIWIGEDVCYHKGIVHGGLLAAMLDEAFAQCTACLSANKIALTASLEISYKAKCRPNAVVHLTATVERTVGRKIWLSGQIHELSLCPSPSNLLVEARALFIVPNGHDE